MKLIFVHGWSVTHTNTYGELPQSLVSKAASTNLNLDIDHIYLGKYVSFHDEVSMDDIARALEQALRDLPGNESSIQPFSCITHSTGGPVVRSWIDKYYGASGLTSLPLQHLVMLAPANHGSSLAVLGKQRVGRIKSWFSGVEPGQRVLDWLSLGSEGQWALNENSMSYQNAENNFFPFVLIGQGIDSKFYDFLNGYLVESGSDGVVRVAGANMNYRYIALLQSEEQINGVGGKVYRLTPSEIEPIRKPAAVPMAVFSEFSHSGNKMGIMANKPSSNNHHIIIEQVLACLTVNSGSEYQKRGQQMAEFSRIEQAKVPEGKKQVIGKYCMLVIRVKDQLGEHINNQDYDILLLAGKGYKPHQLPEGFFVDKQMNSNTHSLVYYIDAEKMSKIKDNCFGIQVMARPNKGFSFYQNTQFRSEGMAIDQVCAANQTTYIDITIHRDVDKNVFRFDGANKPRSSFKNVKPSGDITT
ncbi:esterase/lipase family protein [Agarivorans sp. MS3-6]|uniref:esterase/lipase family protein n=1 Tax=Agarivorans sp. TSD2052 TaxID=2937286 RepID=UPI00200FE80D|nr:phospholipase [Agarivorans sp. TSD2052]UPW20252.1 phospholipase [Agarivorans sp. TSD2052]